MSKNIDEPEVMFKTEKHGKIAKFKRFLFRPFWQRVYRFTGQNWMGNNAPPMTERKILEWDIHEDKTQWNNRAYSIAALVDDGYEVWFGYHNEWRWHMKRKTFNKILLNYLWIQVWHNWFGLREKLYFKALHKMVQKQSNQQKRNGG